LPPSDLELLRLHAANFLLDERGRIRGVDGITIASAVEGHALWLGAEVRDDLAEEMTALSDGAGPSIDPTTPPPVLERCEQLLRARSGSLQCRTGLCYLVEAVSPPPDSGRHIERSDSWSGRANELRRMNPGNWHPAEWDELLDGDLGPCAIATEGARVISVCHTPRPLTMRAAECGVWTHPDFRGHGNAAAVTSAWADLLRPSGRYLFYGTDVENVSSQRVAQRLGLRFLGRTWQLGRKTQPKATSIR
jgi:hypothetical protein